jgi:dephospho-CoA kinase
VLRVGLTGGLGSGKSTAGEIFRGLGVHVLDADDVGRELMQPGEAVYDEIVRRFSEGVLLAADAEGKRILDRVALARVAFSDGRVEELNAIVHPAVIEAQHRWATEIGAREPEAICIVESALIFETKYGGIDENAPGGGDAEDREIAAAVKTTAWRRFDRLVLVTARDEVKIARFVARAAAGRRLSTTERTALENDARQRLALMLPDAVKSPLCDYVMDNNGERSALEAAVRRVYAALVGSERTARR